MWVLMYVRRWTRDCVHQHSNFVKLKYLQKRKVLWINSQSSSNLGDYFENFGFKAHTQVRFIIYSGRNIVYQWLLIISHLIMIQLINSREKNLEIKGRLIPGIAYIRSNAICVTSLKTKLIKHFYLSIPKDCLRSYLLLAVYINRNLIL